MTHSYEDIIRLDSERTQGTISVKETSDKRLSLLVINNGSFPDKVSTQLFINDASYFAAMPDAVGLLKLYRNLLDRAMQGLERLDGQLQIIDPSPSTLGYMHAVTRQTLADIRKQLDGGGK